MDILNEGKKCKGIIAFFDSLNLIAQENFAPLIESKESKIKEAAIEKIMTNANYNLRAAFLRWKNNVEILRL